MYASAQENPAPRRGIALVSTLVVHGLLLLFFILWKIITPIPPFPESEGGGSGLELSLGFTELGMGDNFTDPTPSAPSPQEATAPPPPPDDNSVLTSDVDDHTAVAPEKKPDAKPRPKPAQTKPSTKPQPTKEQQEQAFKDRLSNAWNTKDKGKGGKGGSDVPGVAGGNEGTAEGKGIGNGEGSYRGDGWSVDLAGRTIRRKPVINDKPSVGGKVVMDIWVDGDGKVLRTSQNTSKSTTLDQTLVSIAKRAVLESTFYPNPKATGEQKGSMTFIFTLQ